MNCPKHPGISWCSCQGPGACPACKKEREEAKKNINQNVSNQPNNIKQ